MRGVVREGRDVFHLAIPVDDLDEAEAFYVGALGCKLARRYADRITLDFFGDQLVCHLSDEPRPTAAELSLYPRHFGVTFREAHDFYALHELACSARSSSFRREHPSQGSSKYTGRSCCVTRRTTWWSSSTTPTPG